MIKILTWNINSVRIRLHLLKQLINDEDPDIICLQETKVETHLFPYQAITTLGYPHIAVCGMKSYNGVAILSKHPFTQHEIIDVCNRNDARHIYITIDDIEIHNIYVPAGGDIPDVSENSKFAHKLEFLQRSSKWFQEHKNKKMVIVGDLNIAPLPNDVWSHKQLLKVVSHTPIEVEHLTQLQQSCNWQDVVRKFVPDNEKLYTWWSYRNRDWKKSNRGRRLDHIWITPSLLPNLQHTYILPHARDWQRCSDHVPVILSLNNNFTMPDS